MHAVVLSALTLSMFSQTVWGFKQGEARVGRGIWGIAGGCMAGVFWVAGAVLEKGRDGGRDPFAWAWIDVVCSEMCAKNPWKYDCLMENFPDSRFMPLGIANWWLRW